MFSFFRAVAVFAVAGWLAQTAQATELQLSVSDAQGAPLADAVVTLAGPAGPARPVVTTRMDQKGKMFLPHVLAVRTGTAVTFPNSDDIRHQVYSFSQSKRFELRLYEGTPTAPVVFDRPGVVVLGCNIHDWMLGYIYVTADPRFGVTDAQGHLNLTQLPEGSYSLTLWHPRSPDLRPQAGGSLALGQAPERKVLTLAVDGADGPSPSPPASPFGDAFQKALRENQK
ncbi:methylamine utilization protein [Pseudomonas massiliensis]|uniref:methylamine utilization protein n=1 Tax=Pseudomonas massiliensis TaxID=522492 RepID=UPI00058E7D7D|nr:methylamine utilization protein [Pseudomonas massiliensis]